MAKKSAKTGGREANKSQAIREYIEANPGVGPSAVATALNEREGWKISPAYVSTIKNKTKKPRKARSMLRRKRGERPAAGGSISAQSLMQAKELCKQVGGINQARAALDLLAKLTG